jgi:hypothetical protein
VAQYRQSLSELPAFLTYGVAHCKRRIGKIKVEFIAIQFAALYSGGEEKAWIKSEGRLDRRVVEVDHER